MKFLFKYNSGGSTTVRTGLMKALTSLGHECKWWVQEQQSIYDFLDENGLTNVFVIPSYNLNENIIQRIAETPELIVVLIGSNYGPIDKEIDSEKYPVLKITDEEKRLVSKLLDINPNNNNVVCNYTGQWIDACMGYWRDLGFEPRCLMNAADTLTYLGGEYKEKYACDISMISGKWPYKSQNLDKFFVPLCNPVGRYNIKIWGWGWELIPQYLGQINEDEVKHIFPSTKITINIHEPHSTVFGFEATERMYKALAANSFVVSDYVQTIEDDICPGLPMAKTPSDMVELIDYYLKNEDERISKLELFRNHILDKHTYIHRAQDLLSYIA